jgi:hypothetical protein
MKDTVRKRPDTEFKAYRDRVKEEAKKVKEYLKGKIVPGTESFKKFKAPTINSVKTISKEERKKRDIRRKLAYRSRRINRLRRAQ